MPVAPRDCGRTSCVHCTAVARKNIQPSVLCWMAGRPAWGRDRSTWAQHPKCWRPAQRCNSSAGPQAH
eukprot:405276-Alexandrium_andersonii.AAC.1